MKVKYEFKNGCHIVSTKDDLNVEYFNSEYKTKEQAITEATKRFKQWNHERDNPELYSKYFNVKTGFKVLQEDVNRNPFYFDNSQDFDEIINEEEGE